MTILHIITTILSDNTTMLLGIKEEAAAQKIKACSTQMSAHSTRRPVDGFSEVTIRNCTHIWPIVELEAAAVL